MARKGEGQLKTIPAPTNGLNTKDGYANMSPLDAIALVNWIVDTGGVRCRKGYSEWAVGMTDPVYSILSYFDQTDVFPGGAYLVQPTSVPGKMFAATDNDIYDITNATLTPASVATLSGSAGAGKFSSTMMVNSAGSSFLLACSETDGYYTYDGATWLQVTMGGGATQISGVDPAEFVQTVMWKRRAWFVRRDTTQAWYTNVDSPYGAAAKFDFGPQFKRGGHLAFLANWTVDAGEGIDDFLVAVSSNGDVAVYKGTDPTSASTFSLVGTWFIGQPPVGRRGYVQYGGDLVLISTEGIFPVSYVTRGGAEFLIASSSEYTSDIRSIIGQDLRASFTEFGWQMIIHPSERFMLVNVPDYGSVQSRQYAMATTGNKWSIFANIPVLSLGSIGGYTFAGTRDGRVLLLFNGPFDNVSFGESTGDYIPGLIVPAFNYFDLPAVEKQFSLIRPVFAYSLIAPQVACDISVNFSIVDPTGAAAMPVATEALWDSGVWDESLWAGGTQVYDEWFSCGEVGYCGTATISVNSLGETLLTSIDYVFHSGGVAG